VYFLVAVWWDGNDYCYPMGFHRLEAFKLAGRTDVPAEVYTGTSSETERPVLKPESPVAICEEKSGPPCRRLIISYRDICKLSQSRLAVQLGKHYLNISVGWASDRIQPRCALAVALHHQAV
jgi:hypothetical protein